MLAAAVVASWPSREERHKTQNSMSGAPDMPRAKNAKQETVDNDGHGKEGKDATDPYKNPQEHHPRAVHAGSWNAPTRDGKATEDTTHSATYDDGASTAPYNLGVSTEGTMSAECTADDNMPASKKNTMTVSVVEA